ncbi:MAG: hypothetical protein CMI53_04460 [Parcubacteria group bacterium]|nr:hypothetical protein [Parcubacteria group bacterium]|tara:strand:- start:21044 stop:21649 length:606 start_codon:yes stop_codon:yes gene_type:complete
MVFGFLDKLAKDEKIIILIKYFIYFLLVLSAYWGTLLSLFTFIDFYKTFKVSPNFFQAVYGLIGVIAWINAWYYLKRIRKFGITYLWQKFYQKEKKKIILTIILAIIYFFAFQAFFKGVNFPEAINSILFFLSLPLSFGDSVMFILDVNVRRYLPALLVINKLGFILGLTFEVILFYYLSRIIYWRPKIKNKPEPKNKPLK